MLLTIEEKIRLGAGFEEYLDIHLRRRGQMYFCHFHKGREEGSPSAHLLEHPTGVLLFFCFACQKHGIHGGAWDFVSFIMDFEKVDFRAALETAQRYSGYTLPKRSRGYFQKSAAVAPAKYDLSPRECDLKAFFEEMAKLSGPKAQQTHTNALEGAGGSQVKQTPYQDETTPTTAPKADFDPVKLFCETLAGKNPAQPLEANPCK